MRCFIRNRITRTGRRSGQRHEHGVAMLLVLISLMMATILTTSYVSSRDNSAAIGSNVASAAASRWAADAGLQFGRALLQTEANWRNAHTGGRLLTNYPLAGGTFNLDVMDIEYGITPNPSTQYVRMTATATVNGVSQSAIADCRVPLTSEPEADVDLSEFAVFAKNKVDLDKNATITRWPMAPLATLGGRVLMGTQATGAAAIDLLDDAASVDTTVYYGPGASSMLVAVASGQPPEQTALLDNIPMPAAPTVTEPASLGLPLDLTMNGGTAITNVNARWKKVELRSNAVRTLRNSITVVAQEDLKINSGAKLIIDGDVKICVFGNLDVDQGAIELKSGAKLRLFVRNEAKIKDGYIGELRANTIRDASGKAAYMDPERVLMFSMPSAGVEWRVEGNSVVKASIYAPDPSSVEIREQSALYGRIATTGLRLKDDSAIFYDPALNTRTGYTEPNSPVWDASARMKNEFKTLASLDSSAVQSVADTLNVVVYGLLRTGTKYRPTAGGGSGSPAAGPTDPTPRPLQVEYRLVTLGNSVHSWE